jgi:hypothetical protein
MGAGIPIIGRSFTFHCPRVLSVMKSVLVNNETELISFLFNFPQMMSLMKS